jgi:hypothetical protein
VGVKTFVLAKGDIMSLISQTAAAAHYHQTYNDGYNPTE